MALKKPRLVVGLNLGTSFSGFAWAHVTEPEKIFDYNEYPTRQWQRLSCRTLTTSYYKSVGPGDQWQLESWGNRARMNFEQDSKTMLKLRQRGACSDPVHRMVGEYVTGFMAHFASIDQGALSIDGLPQGLTVDVVVADYLRAMGDLILETLQKNCGPQLTMRQILWCVSVPSTWGNAAKTRMKACMMAAGLTKGVDESPHQLIIVSELEAASAYTLRMMCEQDLGIGDKILTVEIDDEYSNTAMFEVVTVGDLTRRLKEATRSSGDLGSTKLTVDYRFMEVLHGKLGPCLQECIIKDPNVYAQLIGLWEPEKMRFGDKSNGRGRIEIDLPIKLVTEWEYWDQKMDNLERDSYDEVEISHEEMQSIFDPVVEQYLDLVARQLEQEAAVKVLVVVGDLAGLPYFMDCIRQRFLGIVPEIICPPAPEGASFRGAVLMAQQTEVSELRKTRFVNETDSEIQIDYNGDAYTIDPKSSDCVSWFLSDATGTSVPEISLRGIDLASNIYLHHLYGNREIIVSKGVDNAYYIQTFTESVRVKLCSMMEFLLKMERLLNKVKIWRTQCEHLVRQFWRGVVTVRQDLAREPRIEVENWSSLVNFLCSKLVYCMLEGEALLRFCSERENRIQAIFALSSPQPFVPTFSRFGVVFRELDWIFDFSLYLGQCRGDIVFDDWKWCEKRCRMVYSHGGIAGMKSDDMEDEALEADASRQADDRKALMTSMNREEFWTGVDFQSKLQAIWRKRLLASSLTFEPGSVQDCFFLESPADFVYVDLLAKGASKVVNKNKWLGATVAVAIITNIPISTLEAEVSLLARVQHPNVVELMGYAYEKGDLHNSKRFIVTELMEKDLESLISDQHEHTIGGPPFALSVAVDIASQIVEAMIHLKECGVIHRDLKPGNCLVSPKFQKDAWQGYDLIYYCVKVTDFGTSKLRGDDSYFDTRKLGTPSYMAPELYGLPEEKWPYTWSADVYSFGMTCYKIFTGKDPFEVKRLNVISAKVCEGERPSFPSEFPGALQRLIEKCWVRDPRARPTFKDIRKELWQFKSEVLPLMVHGFSD